MENNVCFNLYGWMFNELNLNLSETVVYADILSFSKCEGGLYYGSIDNLAKSLKMSRSTVIRCLKTLTERGLIIKGEIYKNNVRYCTYEAAKNELISGKKEKPRKSVGDGVNNSAMDEYNIPQQEETTQGECQSEDEYYNSLADCVTNSEEFGQCQEMLFDAPEEPKQNKSTKYEIEIKEVIDFLNYKTGGRHKPTNKQTVKDLTRWFKDGHTVEDIKRMISFKCNQWLNDQKMRDYLAPKTLFRLSNFEGYMEASQGYQDFVSDAERGCINV